MANRLAGEKSPYLLQHARNPVDWYPWGAEALERAREEDRPILVSIGYSACHWCHVMERESFEDPEIARLMNDQFVCIKVDREERPDVDAVYMEAVQALSGHGGWPLNVFLTPDRRPFFGGTYFPPQPGRGMPSWRQVLEGVAEMYRRRPDDVAHNAGALTAYLTQSQDVSSIRAELDASVLESAWHGIAGQIDWAEGGIGGAPKFPQAPALELALHMAVRGNEEARRFLTLTLDRMAAGGIHDHLGGGFHRYTVDGRWVVPHFEKMLYDNALLALIYLHAFQLTGESRYQEVVEDTLGYLLRDMRSPEGGFYASEDADSEGVEGKYYVWTPGELQEVLGDGWELAARRWGVRPEGNFEGATILTDSAPVEEIAHATGLSAEEVRRRVSGARERLLEARRQRVPPGKDDKVVTAWNGLAIRALAEAGKALGKHEYLDAAREAADFLLTDLRTESGLVRSFREGPSDVAGFLEDYACLAEGLISLYEASSDVRYLNEARQCVDNMIDRFWDPERRTFYDTPAGANELPVRPRTLFDNPAPSGTSAATWALLRLEALTGEERYLRYAVAGFEAAGDLLERAPSAFGHLLSALDFFLATPLQIAIAGAPAAPDTEALVRVVWKHFLPNRVIAVGDAGSVPLLEGRELIGGRATAYVCRQFACRLPVTEPDALAEQLTTES